MSVCWVKKAKWWLVPCSVSAAVLLAYVADPQTRSLRYEWSTEMNGTYFCHMLAAVLTFITTHKGYQTYTISSVSHSCWHTNWYTLIDTSFKYTQVHSSNVSCRAICRVEFTSLDTLTDIFDRCCYSLHLHEWMNVNSPQAETPHWSQSITDSVKGSTVIAIMLRPQEPEQLIGPNMCDAWHPLIKFTLGQVCTCHKSSNNKHGHCPSLRVTQKWMQHYSTESQGFTNPAVMSSCLKQMIIFN